MDKKSNVKSKLEIKVNPEIAKQKIVFPEIEELTEEEERLKEKLLKLDSKIDSIYNVIESINQERCTVFSDELIFDNIEILASACFTTIINDFLKNND